MCSTFRTVCEWSLRISCPVIYLQIRGFLKPSFYASTKDSVEWALDHLLVLGDSDLFPRPGATPEILVASTHLLLPTILQVTVPLGLGVRAAAWQLRIEVPNLRKAHLILFLHEGEHLFPN